MKKGKRQKMLFNEYLVAATAELKHRERIETATRHRLIRQLEAQRTRPVSVALRQWWTALRRMQQMLWAPARASHVPYPNRANSHL
jgi:hypothetical protein